MATTILEQIISIYFITAYKKEVLSYGLLITKLCLKSDIELWNYSSHSSYGPY